MNLATVMDEVERRVKLVAGLHVYPWAAGKITPPGAVITLPDRINVRGAGRGGDVVEGITVVVCVSRASERTAYKKLAPYVASSGALSVVRALEDDPSTAAFDTLEVDTIEFDFVEYASTPYLAAMITTNLSGPGGTP